jgi:hypothetical protein
MAVLKFPIPTKTAIVPTTPQQNKKPGHVSNIFLFLDINRASTKIRATLAISEGWNWKPPGSGIQRRAPWLAKP